MTTETQPKTRRDKVIGPTPEEASKANRGDYAGVSKTAERVGKSKLGKSIAIGAGIFGGVGVVGAGAYEALNNFPHIPALSRPAEIPTSFDNAADKGTITAANSIIIDSVEAIKDIPTIPPGDNPKHDINLLMPIKGIPDEATIDYSRDFTGKRPENPNYAPSETEYAKENNIQDVIVFKDVPAGTPVLSPIDGYLEFVANPEIVGNTGHIENAKIFYKGDDRLLHQVGLGGKPTGVFIPAIQMIPYGFPGNNSRDLSERQKHWVSVKKGENIMKTSEDTDIRMGSRAWPSGQFGRMELADGRVLPDRPDNIKLIALPDTSGQQKVVVLR